MCVCVCKFSCVYTRKTSHLQYKDESVDAAVYC